MKAKIDDDVVVDTETDAVKEVKIVKTAFSILMTGDDHLSPMSSRLKRLGNASMVKSRR